MRAHLVYAWYIVRHKWFVLLACRFWHVPSWLWVGVMHDWSKLTPAEWSPYVHFFYAPDGSSRGREKDTSLHEDFNRAWNAHQKRNKHHWNYWVLIRDDGTVQPLPMPERYAREMLADWMGAGQAKSQGHDLKGIVAWYDAQKNRMRLHPDTRKWVEAQLSILR